MAWSHVQSAAGAIGFGSSHATYGTNLTSGTKLIAVCFTQGSGFTTSTVSDGTNAFTKILAQSMGGTRGELSLWAVDTPSGDAGTKPTITMTASGGTNSGIVIQEVSGLATGNTVAAMIDGTAGASSGALSSGTTTNPSYTSSASSEYLVSVIGMGGNLGLTAPGALTADANNVNMTGTGTAGGGLAYGNSTNGAETAQWTQSAGSDQYAEILCAFQLPSSPPVITTTSLPLAYAGASYSATLAATGGTPPYTWSVSSGSLPAWASLTGSTGVISGTPTASSASFTVKVTDSASLTATQSLLLDVNPDSTLASAAIPGRARPGDAIPGQVNATSSVLTVTAGLATAAGTAQSPVVLVKPNAGLATAAGTAQSPVALVKPNAGLATAAGTAQSPGISMAPVGTLASGTGSALSPPVLVSPDAVLATATGTAQSPAVALTPAVATAAGTAQSPSASLTVFPAVATATGTAQSPSASLTVFPAVATAAGTALSPPVLVSPDAVLATATGTAQSPSASLTVFPAVATATGTAQSPAVALTPAVATAAGTAQSPSASLTVFPAVATATGTAQSPSASLTVFPAVATATGTAQSPVVLLSTLAVTSLTSGNQSGSVSSTVVTGSVSPAPNSFLILYFSYALSGGATVSSVSGFGATWADTETVAISGSTAVACWTASLGASPGTGAVTVTFAAGKEPSCAWDLEQATGQNQANPIVGGSVVSSGPTTSNAPSLSYNAPASPSDLFSFGVGVNGGPTIAPNESPLWTALANQTASSPGCLVATQVSPDVTNLTGSASDSSATNSWVCLGFELAASTGTVLTVFPGAATATGTAQAPAVSLTVFPAVATATGAAQSPAVALTPAVATAAGTAQSPVALVKPNAGLATAAGTAQSPAVSLTVFPAVATAAGTAQSPVALVKPNAGLATAAGTAQSPAVSLTVFPAVATAAGTAQSPVALVKPNAGLATAAGTAQSPAALAKPNAGLAAGAGTAQSPGASLTVFPAVATAAGTAQSPAALVEPNAGLATGTGTARQPSVNFGTRSPLNLGGSATVTDPYNATSMAVTYDGTAVLASLDVTSGGTAVIASLDAASGGSAVLASLDAASGGTAVSASDILGGSVNYGNTLGGSLIGWTMQQVNLTLAENNDESVNIAITSSSSPLNLSGSTVNMYLKTAAGTADGSALLLSSGGGSPAITITNAPGGLCTVAIPHMDLYPETYTFFRVDVVFAGLQNTAIYGSITWITL